MTNLHITGMFRSGTTLLCKMLDAHRQITCANDPYLPIFKYFRNQIEATKFEHTLAPSRPLDDYYFNPHTNRLMTAIQESTFDLPVPNKNLPSLQREIRDYTADFSPEIANNIGQLKGETYANLLSEAFKLVGYCNQNKNPDVLAFKSAWINEFTKHVLEADQSNKVIVITRDPRAVAASKNALPDKYPWLFLARQWRKQAAFAWEADNNKKWKGRVLCIRYEDLITAPRNEVENICTFLEVDFDENMLNVAGFRDTNGQTWNANSSHYDNVQSFNKNGINKWKEILSGEEIEFIDYLCAPEMSLFDYEVLTDLKENTKSSIFMQPPQISHTSLAKWIRPFDLTTAEEIKTAMAYEEERYSAFFANKEFENDTLKLFYLIPDLYHKHKKTLHFGKEENCFD